ncbi:MAG: hypothetical protein R3D85_04130 [Paracoccaceae bacterium]
MPVEYEIQNDGAFVLARYWGAVSGQEVAELFRRYQADPEFRLDRPHLADVSGVTASDAGFAEVFSLFSMFARFYATSDCPLRVAIYAPADLTFGIARIFQNLAESSDRIETAIFEDMDDARAWLAGLSPPYLGDTLSAAAQQARPARPGQSPRSPRARAGP